MQPNLVAGTTQSHSAPEAPVRTMAFIYRRYATFCMPVDIGSRQLTFTIFIRYSWRRTCKDLSQPERSMKSPRLPVFPE